MIVEVDVDAAVPPYEQIRVQLGRMVGAGVLPAGSRLPPVRQLAADLGVAPGTVARAYRELERDGVLRTRGRHGTFVEARSAIAPDRTGRAERLAAAAHAFLLEARQLGADDEELLGALRHALAAG